MRARWTQPRRLRSWATGGSLEDRAAIVLGAVLLALFTLVNEQVPTETGHTFDLQAAGLLVLATALLLAGRRFRATVAALLLGISVVWYSRYTSRLIDIPTLTAFYMLGATGDRRRELVVGGMAAAILIVGAASSPSDGDIAVEIAVEGVGWTAAAILCGELVRNRRLLLDQYSERAARAEAERDAEAERRVTSERLRIARDLHDVLAHTVSLMTVQAGVAADAVERDADRDTVHSALATLRSAGKEAMAEVRATVAVLRSADADPETAPAPGLERVPELVDAARAQGLDVELTSDVEALDVDNLVALTAYRIVQESLTNAIRHADASTAAVRIQGSPAGLVVEVVDDGRAAPSTPGFGLRGMTERVEATGGELSYGPLPGRGWAVRATLPIRGGARQEGERSRMSGEGRL